MIDSSFTVKGFQLAQGETLEAGEVLKSANDEFYAVMQYLIF
jgi:hypothetical protein